MSKQRRAQLHQLLQEARARGLWLSDDPAFAQKYRAAKQAIDRDSGRGSDELSALQAHVSAFRIDQRFIKRKLSRLDRAIAARNLDEAQRQQLSLASQRVLRLVLAEQLVSASREITRLMRRIRRSARP